MDRKTMVIAVNAVSGGGKTTITRELTGRLQNAKAIYFDDYEEIGQNISDITRWVEDGADYDLWDLQALADDIIKLLEENLDYLVLDYPFGYNQKQIAGLIDISVYIDTPLDIALVRRILRDYSAQGRVDDILKALDAYLHERDAYRFSQIENKEADLVVDGSLNSDEIVDIIIKKIKEK
jgi:uridine kinase